MQPYQIRIVLTHNTTKSHKGAKVFIKGLTPISTNKLEKNTARLKKKTIGIFISQIYAYGIVHPKLLETFKRGIGWKIEIQ